MINQWMLFGFGLIVLANAVPSSCLEQDFNQTSLYFVYGTEATSRQSYPLYGADDILKNAHFDSTKPTALYVHGYQQSSKDTETEELIGCYMTSGKFNVLIYDWGAIASELYPLAAAQVQPLGENMAKVLLKLFGCGLNLSTFHLVGHSLGAQMAGVIGNQVQTCTNGATVLPRITALDPAGPLFFVILGVVPIAIRTLQPTDAKFVDAIHTDGGYLGTDRKSGTVDFYPNRGTRYQPGCPVVGSFMSLSLQQCSHEMSVRFFGQSLVKSADLTSFAAVKALSWTDFQQGKTIDERVVQMGINCPLDVTGAYFLQTSKDKPYSLGLAGTKYVDRDSPARALANKLALILSSIVDAVFYQ